MLNLKNLQKSFGDIQILRDLSFTLESGNSASIRGASGSGKSTLLSLIAGFELPDGGTIHIDDVTLPFASDNAADAFRRDHLGVVFQSFNLLDCLNVWDNIAFTARLKGNHDKDFQRTLMNDMAIACQKSSPTSYPAVSNSAWPSPARWFTNPRWFWQMNRQETWMKRPASRSLTLCLPSAERSIPP